MLTTWTAVPTTLVLFERASRLPKTLALAAEILGPRQGCIARELTKLHEEFSLDGLGSLASSLGELRGEVTVVIGPPPEPPKAGEADIEAVLDEELAQGGRPKDVARRAAARIEGVSAKECYQRLLAREGR
jgi:16S rRNA (cytidine1402-2'-O)-methyltransferase